MKSLSGEYLRTSLIRRDIGWVMVWCHQATSHYLSQCWPRSMASLGHNELSHWPVDEQNVWLFADDIYFNCIFLNENILNLLIPIDISLGSNWQVSNGSGNSLVPHRHQAITWTNDDLGLKHKVTWCLQSYDLWMMHILHCQASMS